MNITEIQQMLVNRLSNLEMNKQTAFITGDIEAYSKYELDIDETKLSISQIDKILNPQNQ